MSRQLLSALNGNKSGELKKFLNSFEGEPRIAWYPSAGFDFRALMYLHPNFSLLSKPQKEDPLPPDIFLYTDYFPYQNSTFLDTEIIYSDSRTIVFLEHIEELPKLDLPLHEEIVDFIKGGPAKNKIVFLKIHIESKKLGSFTFPVIYAFVENEAFYCKKLALNDTVISHIIHVRYGGGCGGGGNASGIWLLNVLKKLKCELFVTDSQHFWQYGDNKALEICPSIPKESNTQLSPIRVIDSQSWSGNGDVSWNLVL